MIDLSDPISRQQTITALRALSDEYGYINAPHEVVTDVVRGLPPVKAEHNQTTHSEQTKKDKLGVKTGETCEDCISRQAAIDALHMHLMYRMGTDSNKKRLDDWLNGVPSVQPERKKGKWNFIGDQMFECTECGTCYTQGQFHQMRVRITDSEFPKFCPNCGADMRGEQND